MNRDTTRTTRLRCAATDHDDSSGRVAAGSTGDTGADLDGSEVAAHQATEALVSPFPAVVDVPPILDGSGATWVIVGVVVLLLVMLGGGRRRGSGRGGTRPGSGGTGGVLIIGALIGATLIGSSVIRSVISTLIELVTTLGGLFQ